MSVRRVSLKNTLKYEAGLSFATPTLSPGSPLNSNSGGATSSVFHSRSNLSSCQSSTASTFPTLISCDFLPIVLTVGCVVLAVGCVVLVVGCVVLVVGCVVLVVDCVVLVVGCVVLVVSCVVLVPGCVVLVVGCVVFVVGCVVLVVGCVVLVVGCVVLVVGCVVLIVVVVFNPPLLRIPPLVLGGMRACFASTNSRSESDVEHELSGSSLPDEFSLSDTDLSASDSPSDDAAR